MGYSHYFRRVPLLDRDGFIRASEEISILTESLAAQGVPLASPTGEGRAEINADTIAFNGIRSCGHRYRDFGKPWPSDTAEGVAGTDNPVADEEPWAFGPHLQARACDGSCARDPLIIDRVYLKRDWDRLEKGMYFSWCETGYKPYDLAVTAALMRLKENLGEQISISSSGGERAFTDAKRLCRELFGWSGRFEIELAEPQLV